MVMYFIVMQISLNLLVGELEIFYIEEQSLEACRPGVHSKILSLRKRLMAVVKGDENVDGTVSASELEARISGPKEPENQELVRHIVVNDAKQFDVTTLIGELMKDDVTELINFDTSAWLFVMVYALSCMALTRFACFSDLSAYAVGIGIDAIWLTSSLYAAARVTFHDSQLQKEFAEGTPAPQLWPAIWFDRLCFPFQFGVVGSFFWTRGVSEERALNAFQAMLFFELYSMVQEGVVLAFGSPETAPYNALIDSLDFSVLIFVGKAILVVLWGAYTLPRLVIAFCLPPFCTKEDEEKLFKNLKASIKAANGGVSQSSSPSRVERSVRTPQSKPWLSEQSGKSMFGYFVNKSAGVGHLGGKKLEAGAKTAQADML